MDIGTFEKLIETKRSYDTWEEAYADERRTGDEMIEVRGRYFMLTQDEMNSL